MDVRKAIQELSPAAEPFGDKMRSRFQSTLVATIAALLVVVVSASSLRAQLVVESVSIANGAVNVPEVTDISVTFSEALDPIYVPSSLDVLTGVLPINLNLLDPACPLPPAGIFVTPGGCPESVELSGDGKTVTMHNVQLEPSMAHTLVVLFARGQGGSSLAVPSVTRFSTGDALPQGGIAGAVASSDTPPAGTILLAVKAPLDIAGADSTFEANLGFAGLDGSYSIDFVEDGTYHVIGLQIDLANPDAALQGLHVGTVDGNSDHIADAVEVSGGSVVSGANVSIASEGATAAELNTPALDLVHMDAPMAQLALAAGAGLNLDGTALTWIYLYMSPAGAYAAASLGSFVFPPQLLDLGEDADLLIGVLGSAPVPPDFGDSDGAISGFMNAGGSEYLSENQGAIGVSVLMNAELFTFIQTLLGSGDLTGLLGSPAMKVLHELTAIPNIQPRLSKETGEVWIVAFIDAFGPSLHLVAMDDAGNPLLVVGSSPARANEAAASAAATAWASDAVLVTVSTDISPIDGRGSAIVWGFNYYSASKDSVMNVVVSAGARGGVLATDVLSSTDDVPSLSALPDSWIDSPAAIQAARPRGEPFTAQHSDASATVVLSKGLQDGNPDLAIWRVALTGTNGAGDTESINIDIDAVSGVYVAVEDDGVQPTAFELGQNYPNPFNPSTAIPYRVDERSHVSLEVFDALGRRVATLVDQDQPAGSYQAVWDASQTFEGAVPSGVYLYRLKTESSVKTRTMMLLK